ncbi:MAG: MarR family winged helix-turn-helix transcriptional regulator [Pontixanthobacter sp.]
MDKDGFNLAGFLPYQLSVASNAVSMRIARVYQGEFGLKVTEWRVMAMLGDAGAQTQRELTARTLMDKVAVNRACKSLEAKSLARRVPNQRDGRSHHLELTEEGQAMYDAIVPLAKGAERDLLALMTQEQQQMLRDLLARMRDHAS